jgi:O-methyltransferase
MRVSRLSRQVVDERLTYLSWSRLRNLEQAAKAAASLEGDYLECGVGLGGSAAVIGATKPQHSTLHLYDTFGMIPPPGDNDPAESMARYEEIASGASEGIGGDQYYGYVTDLEGQVRQTLERFGVEAVSHPGVFEETLEPGPVAFAHIDCDWYDSVRVCLERIYPRLVAGGQVVIDDYYDWGGARRAVDEFLAREPLTKVAGGPGTNLVLARERTSGRNGH